MVEVHMPSEQATEIAQKLLAAASELGLPASVVATSSSGLFGLMFLVPDEVHDLAMGVTESEVVPDSDATDEVVTPAKRKPGRPKKIAAEPVELPEEPEE